MMASACSDFFQQRAIPGADRHAVGEHRGGKFFNIVGDAIVAAFQQSQRLGRAIEGLRAARTDPQGQVLVFTRTADN